MIVSIKKRPITIRKPNQSGDLHGLPNKISRGIERVPGGMMIVPLLLVLALVAILSLGMPKFSGSFTNALFTARRRFSRLFIRLRRARASTLPKRTIYLAQKGRGAVLSPKSARQSSWAS